jgi:AraC-like DNA-binding protein
MEQLSDWYFTLVFFASILGFVVAVILFFVNKTDSFSSRLLSGYLVCISLLALNYALMTTTYFQRHPHLWRILAWSSFSFSPMAYLYVRSVLEQSYRFKKWDFLFFLPAILHALNLLPFYLLPASEKLEVISNAYINKKLIALEPEGLLPERWAIWARILVGLLTTFGQFFLLSKWKSRIYANSKNEHQNISTFRWLNMFTLIQALFWSLVILEFIFHFSRKADLNYTIIFTITGTIFFISMYLLLRPSILYGMTGWLQTSAIADSIPDSIIPVTETVSTNKNTLSIEQGEAYKRALESHFRENLPFRKNGYTIGDLSHELNIPSHQLSAFINQEYGKNFNELINEYRVDYLSDTIRSSNDHLQFTLEALGREAGFNSRAAFIAAVKKKTGKTPSELFGRRGESTPK